MMSETQSLPQAAILNALSGRHMPRKVGSAWVVSTDVLYPGGTSVAVVVEGGAAGERVTASDAGYALGQLTDAGISINHRITRAAQKAASEAGLVLEGSVLRTHPEAIANAAFAVVVLANGARDVAHAAFMAARRHERIWFRQRVQVELARIFAEGAIAAEARLFGHSTKSHRFDFVVTLGGGKRLVIDAPVPDHGSVAAVVMRQLDLRRAKLPGMRQAIAFDRNDHWQSSTLAQLELADVPLISAKDLREGLSAVVEDAAA